MYFARVVSYLDDYVYTSYLYFIFMLPVSYLSLLDQCGLCPEAIKTDKFLKACVVWREVAAREG